MKRANEIVDLSVSGIDDRSLPQQSLSGLVEWLKQQECLLIKCEAL
jgi:hypothetical protein